MILTLTLSILVGVSLGLLGGGGTILMVPILLYAGGLGAKEAIGTSLLVVALASALGAFQQRKHLDLRTGALFGAAGMAGAYGGGRLAELIPAPIILAVFVVMMLVTAAMMLRSSATTDELNPAQGPRPILRILGEGVIVGAVTGLVGAGGGFLVVPALVLLGGLSMKRAIATSLFVIAVKSLAGFAGYLGHVDVELGFALAVAGFAMLGIIAGTRLARRFSAARLKKTFALLTIGVALFMIARELPEPFYRAVFIDRWPWWAGGAAIAGVALALLYAKNQLLGVSTGCAELSKPCALVAKKPSWRIPFLGGIVLGGSLSSVLAGRSPSLSIGLWHAIVLLIGGVLIGFGSRRAGGCTSGHTIAGVAQGSRSSILATSAFLIGGFITAHLVVLFLARIGS